MQAVRCLVAGRVQAVGFRAATAAEARSLGLDGWVRNLADGRVEVVAAGAPDAVQALTRWLWQGPAAARVDSVQLEQWTAEMPRGFGIAR